MPTLPIHCADGRTTHLDLSDAAYAHGYLNCLRDVDLITGLEWEHLYREIEAAKQTIHENTTDN